MAGFVIRVIPAESRDDTSLKLVDLGSCEEFRIRRMENVSCAWARWSGSRQLVIHENQNRLLFVEGEPDRMPAANEAAHAWLPGRTGSFRGFEVELRSDGGPAHILAFVDPLGTRPIFVLKRSNAIYIADKLSTIAANAAGLECSWPSLLEACVLGATYSPETTVKDVVQLEPGEILSIDGFEAIARQGTIYTFDNQARPDPNAPRRLGDALRHAIQATWVDQESRLLLSGGLDSRLILGLAEPHRKTMIFDWFREETPIALQVAEACNADNIMIPFNAEDYCKRMQFGYLVTGAMQQSRFVNNLGMATDWRRSGVPGITHGYFHNTVFRGWTAGYWQRYPDLGTTLARYMKGKAHYFDNFGHYSLHIRDAVLNLLSQDGRRLLADQLGRLGESIETIVVDGYDLTFERFILSRPARQIYFGIFLGWIEEIDVASPVFHEASLRWYTSTHPSDRHADQAVNALYQTLGQGLADIPDFATGQPVRPHTPQQPSAWRNSFLFPIARSIVHAVRRSPAAPSQPNEARFQHWHTAFRQAPILEALHVGVKAAGDSGLFDRAALRTCLDGYLGGRDDLCDVLWSVASAGQLADFVATCGADNPAVRDEGDIGRLAS